MQWLLVAVEALAAMKFILFKIQKVQQKKIKLFFKNILIIM